MDRFYKYVFFIVTLVSLISCEKPEGVIEVSGILEGEERAVSARVMGVLEEVKVGEGDSVEEDDILFISEHSVYEYQLQNAQAAVEIALQNLKKAEKNFQTVKKNRVRIIKLYSEGSATEKQKDDIDNKYTMAESQLKSAESHLKKARAQYNVIKEKLDNCIVRAPLSATVTEKVFNPGEFVNPGSPVIVLTKMDTMKLTVYIPEDKLGMVKLGQKAIINIDTYPKKEFRGTITWISDRAEFTPKNVQTKEERVKQVFAVEVSVPNQDKILKSGMPADASIFVD